jgi:hypothetical protein
MSMIAAIQPRMRDFFVNAAELLDELGFSEAVFAECEDAFNSLDGLLLAPMPSSLAVAVIPFKLRVPNTVSRMIYALEEAAARCEAGTSIVSHELLAAVLFYTHNGPGEMNGCKFYQQLNVALRSRVRGNAKPYFGYLRMLVEALSKLPSHKGLVYRGVAGIDLTDKFPIGKPVRIWEVLSASKKRQVAEGFASYGNKAQQTFFVIDTPGVAMLGSLSLYPLEEECLFLPGTAFVATKAEYVGGLAVIHLAHRAEDVTVLYK